MSRMMPAGWRSAAPGRRGRTRAVRASIAALILLALMRPCAAAESGDGRRLIEARVDAVAESVRAAERIGDPKARADALRAAAAAAEAHLAKALRGGGVWLRLQSDRLYALSLAGEHADAARVYDAIRATGHPVRPYLLPAAGESLIATGRVEEGEALLRAAMRDPANDARPVRRLAASLEQRGERAAARGALAGWLAETQVSAAERRDAVLLLARLERWDEEFDASAQRLAALARDLPDDGAVRQERAALERQRGRPRAALALLHGHREWDDRFLAAQSWLDLGRTDRGGGQLEPAQAPELDRRLAAERGSRGGAGAGYANTQSSAIASPNGAGEVSAWVRADTPRLADHWRVGMHAAMHRAEFKGERPEAQYAGARITHHGTGGETSLEAGRSFDDFIERDYAILETGYWVTDAVRLGARAARDDPDGPLQARASGIGIDSLSLAGTYRPEPAWRFDAGIGGARFDDGNDRRFAALSAERRLRARGGSVTSGFVSAYAARNSLDAAAYFNPASAESLELGLSHRFAAPARLAHSLRPSVAGYWQDGFGATLVPLLGYSLRMPAGAGAYVLDLGASQPVYDGQRETRVSAALSYAWGP